MVASTSITGVSKPALGVTLYTSFVVGITSYTGGGASVAAPSRAGRLIFTYLAILCLITSNKGNSGTTITAGVYNGTTSARTALVVAIPIAQTALIYSYNKRTTLPAYATGLAGQAGKSAGYGPLQLAHYGLKSLAQVQLTARRL